MDKENNYEITGQIIGALADALQTKFPSVPAETIEQSISKSKHSGADFEITLAFKTDISPDAILAAIQEAELSQIETAWAEKGYVNIKLTAQAMIDLLDSDLYWDTRQSWIIDFAGPNLGKPLHLGHAKNMILGNTIAKILDFQYNLGHTKSHYGDQGLPFAMAIAYAEQYPETPFESIYTKAKALYETDLAFAQAAQQTLLKIQAIPSPLSHDTDWMGEISYERKMLLASYRDIWLAESLLAIEENLNDAESQVFEWGGSWDEILTGAIEDDGCLIYKTSGDLPPVIVKKSNGAYTYAAYDLASLYKHAKYEPHSSFAFITDEAQADYFKGLFEAAQQTDWFNKFEIQELKHIPTGFVLDADGKKMSSSAGAPGLSQALKGKTLEQIDSFIIAQLIADPKMSGLIKSDDQGIASALLKAKSHLLKTEHYPEEYWSKPIDMKKSAEIASLLIDANMTSAFEPHKHLQIAYQIAQTWHGETITNDVLFKMGYYLNAFGISSTKFCLRDLELQLLERLWQLN